MRKKLLSLALALVMCLSVMPSAFAAGSDRATPSKFNDVPENAWYWDELDYAVYNGYISGTSATTFSPDSPVTRGQFVTILGRMLKVDTSSYTSTSFKDVEAKSWYGPYVIWAQSKGFVNGTSATTFAPNNNITVEQMGTILANYIGKTGVVLTGTTPQEQYTDVGTISGWASKNMELMRQYDLLPVDGKGNVSPRKAATRAEATVSLVRLAKAVGWGTEPDSYVTPELPVDNTDAQLNARVKEIHDELWNSGAITRTSTEKEKAIAYWDWMCHFCHYGTGSLYGYTEYQSHTIYGALFNGYAVCDGLSKAYLTLLEYDGIKCKIVTSSNHAWNEAFLDGETYTIDMTDAVTMSKNVDGTYNSSGAENVRNKYFFHDDWEADLGVPMD